MANKGFSVMTKKHQIQIEMKDLIVELGITPENFCAYSGISMDAFMATPVDTFSQSRCNDIYTILNNTRPWFDSKYESWAWYISQPILGFGNITAAEVVKQHSESGVKAIIDYIASKELAAFE
jgi:hypothetical protein